MEQITITLSRETLEQLPPSVLVGLLMGQPEVTPKEVQSLGIETNNADLSLFPAEPIKVLKPKNSCRVWTNRDDINLIYGYSKGHLSDEALAEMLKRSVQGVKMRIWRLKRDGKL